MKDKANSSDEDEPQILSESESDDATFEAYAKRLEEDEEALKQDELFLEGVENLKIGNWVMVSFKAKKSILFYAGQITTLDEESQPTIKFLKKSNRNANSSVFHWPEQEDHHLVAASDIERVLPESTLGRRGELTFPVFFAPYNVK
ncbi:unnamed protein product [Acanthoscelides obtectus]|uniref:Uncharacterized protein n=1 Tax=Acanthoscelides obtectus TaxID=200917 RepID=A0A9P0JPR1_ACAOB|nr:unnamed protein product [Acanthoscelides obtectus]CAK1678691.1 hypothetical protein AOBTE_LOCUS32000 [Acanthoscelides obtectus]